MTTCAIDPGISVGCAMNRDGLYSSLVIVGPQKVWEWLHTVQPSTIIVENFASGGIISSEGQATIRLVGAVELAAHILGAKLVLHQPAERYPMMAHARQIIKGSGRLLVSHEVDAMAHLLLYEKRTKDGVVDKITQGRRHTYQ